MEKVILETAEQFREAIGVLAAAITRLEEVQLAQGDLLRAIDLRVKLLTSKPQGGHHA